MMNPKKKSDEKIVPVPDNSLLEKEIAPVSTIPTKPINEITQATTKSLSYIFKQNATRKKLEKIARNLANLTTQSAQLEEDMKEPYRQYSVWSQQCDDLRLQHGELLSSLQKNMVLYGIETFSIITDSEQSEIFLKQYVDKFRKQLRALGLPLEDKEKTALIYQERAKMRQILKDLKIHYDAIVTKQTLLKEINNEAKILNKKIIGMKKQFDEIQDALEDANKEYDKEDNDGFLESYESPDPKVSIDEMVTTPELEKQLKKLINTYLNRSETKNFGIAVPKGVLLLGDKDTGKTFFARVLASAIDRKLYHIKAHDLFSGALPPAANETPLTPNDILEIIFYAIIDHVQKEKEPCAIFLDEIEKIIGNVVDTLAIDRTLISNTILKNIINIQKSGLDIVIMASVTEKNQIDDGFLKYTLFDNQFFFELPEEKERKKLFEFYIDKAEKRAKLKLFYPGIIDTLVAKTKGFSAEYIKQLISSCVDEYAYTFGQEKHTFSLKKEVIGKIVEENTGKKESVGEDIEDANVSSQDQPLENPKSLSSVKRKKVLGTLINKYTVKHLVFGALDHEKKDDLMKYLLHRTRKSTEDQIVNLFESFDKEYQKNKSNYHRNFLIKESFVLEQIEALRDEDRRKGKKLYFSNL